MLDDLAKQIHTRALAVSSSSFPGVSEAESKASFAVWLLIHSKLQDSVECSLNYATW